MPNREEVMFAFVLGSVTCDGMEVFFVDEAVFAACQNFVRVGLVGNIPDDLIRWRIKNMVEGNRQFGDTQVRSDVAADLADLVQNKRADLSSQLVHFNQVQFLHVCGAVHFVYDGCL
ncbi:hypothetical protein SDC9_134480 [bioreactor metagenome]|uniref:Uncharacterized protein n=1 Tax=bioreactor metagenome TaxID=1076179 RepID=A0A645DDA9_9ZZZZ